MKIPLTQGKTTIIDDEDYPIVSMHKWYAAKHRNTFYALTTASLGNGKQKTLRMHRVLMGAADGEIIDHVDGDGLNNRRATNLRSATSSQNAINRRTVPGKGVYIHKPTGKYRAVIGFQRKRINLGIFVTRDAAIEAYNLKAKELHGEFAVLGDALCSK